MKKKTAILIVILLACAGVLAGTGYLFHDFFPKAKPVRCPEPEQVWSVTLSCDDKEALIPMSGSDVEILLLYIREAKPTRRQSLNDRPDVRPYYGIAFNTGDIEYRYFLYIEGEQAYLEMPYEGVYVSKTELLDLVLTYFAES